MRPSSVVGLGGAYFIDSALIREVCFCNPGRSHCVMLWVHLSDVTLFETCAVRLWVAFGLPHVAEQHQGHKVVKVPGQ